MVTGSRGAPSTGSSSPAAVACPPPDAAAAGSLTDDLSLRLDELLPGGRWVLVADSAELADQVRRRFFGEGPPDTRVVTTQVPGWERGLGGLRPQDGILVGVDAAAWSRCVRALTAARLHPGPLVLVHHPGHGAEAPGGLGHHRPIHLATGDGPVPAVVLRSYRGALKSGDPEAGRALPQRRVSNEGRARPGSSPRPHIDLTVFNPIGRRPGGREPLRTDVDGLGTTIDGILADGDLPRYVEIAPADSLAEEPPATQGEPDPDRPAVPSSDTPPEQRLVARILELSCLGVPVRFPAGPPARLEDGAPDVAEVLRRMQALDLDDASTQEAASVRVRRAAMREHGRVGAEGPLPPYRVPVSVLLSSNRPDQIAGALERIADQDHGPLEVVVAAHGFDPGLVVAPRDDLAMTVLAVPGSASLGEALGAATEAAAGAVLVKMDDDDLYAATHVTDLVLGLRYSGATVAGKAPEFVYLRALDVTVRRGLAAERFGGHIAGGTIAINRGDLLDVGGWAPVPRAVDSRLLDAVHRAGGSVYRTHGFGFVLNRHGQGHAFDVGGSRYLERTVAQRAGLDLEFAGVTEGTVAARGH